MTSHALHILIPTAGKRPDALRDTLRSVESADRPACDLQTLVIHNGPSRDDAVQRIIEPFGESLCVNYLFHNKANKSTALNAGLATLTDGLVLFLDDDVLISHCLLREYASAGKAFGPGHFMGGPVTVKPPAGVAPPPAWHAKRMTGSTIGWTPPVCEVLPRRHTFLGFNWAAFVQDLHLIQGFDARRGPGSMRGGSETDAQLRLRARGVRSITLHKAVVQHCIEPELWTTGASLRRIYRNSRSLGLYGREGVIAEPSNRMWWGLKYKIHRTRAAFCCRASYLRAVLRPTEVNRFSYEYWSACRKGLFDGWRDGEDSATTFTDSGD